MSAQIDGDGGYLILKAAAGIDAGVVVAVTVDSWQCSVERRVDMRRLMRILMHRLIYRLMHRLRRCSDVILSARVGLNVLGLAIVDQVMNEAGDTSDE